MERNQTFAGEKIIKTKKKRRGLGYYLEASIKGSKVSFLPHVFLDHNISLHFFSYITHLVKQVYKSRVEAWCLAR